MPKWLEGMIAPTCLLWLNAIALAIANGICDKPEFPRFSGIVFSVALASTMASWAISDARKRGYRVCYDFDTFVFCAWPLVLPIYLFQTRGARAFLTILCFLGICFTGMWFGMIFETIRIFVLAGIEALG